MLQVVCIKQVADTETRVKVAADGRSLDPAGVTWILNPYDEFALEQALRIREAEGQGEERATLGPAPQQANGRDIEAVNKTVSGLLKLLFPDPEMAENMRDLVAKVTEVGADVGLAYDGDADRVGIVDERGRRHEADLLLALLARDLLVRHPGAKIIFDVKSSQVLVDDIRRHGGEPIMWKTGHSLLKRKMREDGILLGGAYGRPQYYDVSKCEYPSNRADLAQSVFFPYANHHIAQTPCLTVQDPKAWALPYTPEMQVFYGTNRPVSIPDSWKQFEGLGYSTVSPSCMSGSPFLTEAMTE